MLAAMIADDRKNHPFSQQSQRFGSASPKGLQRCSKTLSLSLYATISLRR
jgi:hypothetical protein